MSWTIPLRCRCGSVRGVARGVSRGSGFRFFCYCRDCQAFARFLGQTDILDPAGGTDIFQTPPARSSIDRGADALRCVRFSDKVLRWYAHCCRTPIGNTAASARFPVFALIHSFMDHEALGRSRDDVLGPPLCRIYESSRVGPLPPNAAPPPSARVFGRRAWMILGWWVRGLAKPSPFFDDLTGAPRAEPRVLSRSQRERS